MMLPPQQHSTIDLRYRTAYLSALTMLETSLSFKQTYLSDVYASLFICWDRTQIRFFPNTTAPRLCLLDHSPWILETSVDVISAPAVTCALLSLKRRTRETRSTDLRKVIPSLQTEVLFRSLCSEKSCH